VLVCETHLVHMILKFESITTEGESWSCLDFS